MARPQKEGIDYFPLDVDMDHDDKIQLIEAEHGVTGFGIIIKLLMKIYAEGYYYKWSKKEQLLFSRRANVDINVVNAVINSCLRWGMFDNEVYKKHQILTSSGIQKRYIAATSRRKDVQMLREYLLIDASSAANIVIADINGVNDDNNPAQDRFMLEKTPQSKVKESKVKKRKRTPCPTDGENIENSKPSDAQPSESLTVLKTAGMAAGSETREQPSTTLAEKMFNEFWALYPKKVGKKLAFTSWKKAKIDKVLYEKIMSSVARAKASVQWQRERGRFIPNPATWLNQGRWDDEYEEEHENAKSTRTGGKYSVLRVIDGKEYYE